MENDEIKKFLYELIKAESEDDVEQILNNRGMLDNKNWKYFGANENNFSIIGNQQSKPIPALVEKIVNSADAILMKLCMQNGISPNDNVRAPKSIFEALEKFLGIPEGNIDNLETKELKILSEENILLVATSKDGKLRGFKPCISIIDNGEGQDEKSFEKTLLSLSKTNKLSIPFVQGKFNMGGTGVLEFCGEKKYQLILSKRHNCIIDSKSDNKWTFTIVRKQEPVSGQRSSSYTYLAPGGNLLSFSAESLRIKPNIESSQRCIPYQKEMRCGTFIKLYNYDMKKYNSKNITTIGGLTDGLNKMIARTAIPIRLVECRKVKGRTPQITVTGYEVRLKRKGRVQENIEEGFPVSSSLFVDGERMKMDIYAFKKGKEESYKESNSSILFTLNGQTQGFLPEDILSRKSVGLDYIKKSILIIIDCSELSISNNEALFMNSRDRLRETNFSEKVKEALISQLASNYALRELREKRRDEELNSKITDNTELKNSLSKILNKFPNFKEIFSAGEDLLAKEIVVDEDGDGELDYRKNFDGKDYPTFFKLKTKTINGLVKRKWKKELEYL